MPRYFTLQQAQQSLPRVEQCLREAIVRKEEYQNAEQQMDDISRSIVMTGGMKIDRGHVIGIKETRERSAERLQQLFEEIQSMGCLVKDLDIGLLDFPTLYRGEEVYLCWRLGESDIRFWHGVEEGFRGRKEIDEDFLANHEGEA